MPHRWFKTIITVRTNTIKMDIHIIIFCFIQSWFYLTNKFGGIARDKGIWLYIMHDNTAGSDHSILTDGNASRRYHQTARHDNHITSELHVSGTDTRKRCFDTAILSEMRKNLVQ